MGLDSVHLITSFEEFFRIEVPSGEWEKARTVSDTCLILSKYLGIEDEGVQAFEELFIRIKEGLISVGLASNSLHPEDKLFLNENPDYKIKLQHLSEKLGLNVPMPQPSTTHNLLEVVFKIWQPKNTIESITASQLVNAIGASNFEKLINPDVITNRWQILLVVMSITVDQIGVDYFEILPESSFTKDLGID